MWSGLAALGRVASRRCVCQHTQTRGRVTGQTAKERRRGEFEVRRAERTSECEVQVRKGDKRTARTTGQNYFCCSPQAEQLVLSHRSPAPLHAECLAPWCARPSYFGWQMRAREREPRVTTHRHGHAARTVGINAACKHEHTQTNTSRAHAERDGGTKTAQDDGHEQKSFGERSGDGPLAPPQRRRLSAYREGLQRSVSQHFGLDARHTVERCGQGIADPVVPVTHPPPHLVCTFSSVSRPRRHVRGEK